MLVAGVVLGVLLGPAALGRLAPKQYDAMFVGSGDTSSMDQAQADLMAFDSDEATRTQAMEEVVRNYDLVGGEGDSTRIARDEQLSAMMNRFADQRDQLNSALIAATGEVVARQQTHHDKLAGMATVMLLLVVLLLAAEAILSPQRYELERGRTELPPVLSRLVTVRYALAAGWLMLMLARPVWLRGIDPWFGAVLLVVVLVAGLAPLGKRSAV